MKRGFTVVELVITMSIMAILLTLGIVSFTGVQTQSRDKERESDVATIARGLERRYKAINPVVTSTAYSDVLQGRYPSLLEIRHALGETVAAFTPSSTAKYLTRLLPGTKDGAFQPPTSTGKFDIICTGGACTGLTPGSATALNAHFGPSTGTSTDKYVYEPITSAGAMCTENVECVRFNLYWYSEVSGSVQKVESKKQ